MFLVRETTNLTAYLIYIIGTFITPPQPSPLEGRVRDSAGGVYLLELAIRCIIRYRNPSKYHTPYKKMCFFAKFYIHYLVGASQFLRNTLEEYRYKNKASLSWLNKLL